MATTPITFNLDIEEDRDILQYFDRLRVRQRSEEIRKALKQYIHKPVTLNDVYLVLVEVREMLQAGAVADVAGAGSAGGDPGEDDPRAARARRKIAGLGL